MYLGFFNPSTSIRNSTPSSSGEPVGGLLGPYKNRCPAGMVQAHSYRRYGQKFVQCRAVRQPTPVIQPASPPPINIVNEAPVTTVSPVIQNEANPVQAVTPSFNVGSPGGQAYSGGTAQIREGGQRAEGGSSGIQEEELRRLLDQQAAQLREEQRLAIEQRDRSRQQELDRIRAEEAQRRAQEKQKLDREKSSFQKQLEAQANAAIADLNKTLEEELKKGAKDRLLIKQIQEEKDAVIKEKTLAKAQSEKEANKKHEELERELFVAESTQKLVNAPSVIRERAAAPSMPISTNKKMIYYHFY